MKIPSLQSLTEELEFLGSNIDAEHYVKLVVDNEGWYVWSSDYLIYNNLATEPPKRIFNDNKDKDSVWMKLDANYNNFDLDYEDMAKQMISSIIGF
jgi:hypothetical protein